MKLYTYRNYIKQLYTKEPQLNSNFIDNVLSIQDKYINCIKEIKYNHADSILITLSDNVEKKDKINIISDIGNYIKEFVIENIDQIKLDEDEKKDFEKFILQNSSLLCDYSCIGSQITFNL